ncbi:MAG TPA: hypothetical protein VK140_10940 [Ktedonobacteraceae bacterium]|nr:hypothetical protein [Ktedonobacteraceae bacterium]
MLKLTNRTSLYALMLLAPFAWGGLLLFTRFVPPYTLLAYLAFFVLLGVALTSTFAPMAYFIGLRFLSSRLYRATVRHALRQGALLSLCIVINMVLLSLRSWNIFTAMVIFVAAMVIEVVSLARK